jgi:D-tyrosyl-tRNA(Tyr) deacylase
LIALIQRVSEARVAVGGETAGAIGRGILALVAVERGDGDAQAARLAERVLGYRVFPDADDRMNLSLLEIGGELLAVPQFTLAADTRAGSRPGFSAAAAPEEGRRLFGVVLERFREKLPGTKSGIFGADMKVHLVNDGPVTFWLQVQPPGA